MYVHGLWSHGIKVQSKCLHRARRLSRRQMLACTLKLKMERDVCAAFASTFVRTINKQAACIRTQMSNISVWARWSHCPEEANRPYQKITHFNHIILIFLNCQHHPRLPSPHLLLTRKLLVELKRFRRTMMKMKISKCIHRTTTFLERLLPQLRTLEKKSSQRAPPIILLTRDYTCLEHPKIKTAAKATPRYIISKENTGLVKQLNLAETCGRRPASSFTCRWCIHVEKCDITHPPTCEWTLTLPNSPLDCVSYQQLFRFKHVAIK